MRITKDHLPFNSNMLWLCPHCYSINAWNYGDAQRAEVKTREEIFISHGSCFDNVCGNCGSNIVKPDSPILTEVYTHE